jgi:cyclic pyranopterin monophosphate synthase
MTKLTHLDDSGAARMVDVAEKPATLREAKAEGKISMTRLAITAIREATTKKGDVLAVARVAGIMAAKRTSDLIPLCHPVALSTVTVDFDIADTIVTVRARVGTTGPTGVEMEALTAVSVALLTIYDMAKALDRGMIIGEVRLLEKSGGRSGDWHA